jgi:hypothetical protein
VFLWRRLSIVCVCALAGPFLISVEPAAAVPKPCRTTTPFHKHEFDHGTTINNNFLPLIPGTQFTLDGITTDDEGTEIPRRVILTVTDLTKEVDGVRTVVLWDRDFADGQLVEAELAFQAQDNSGVVWNLGEYPEEFEEGQFVGAPSTWIAGLDRAKAGQHMLAQPTVGTPEYLQGSAPTIDFLDCGQVYRTGQRVCVPGKCYDGVLVINERSPLEPDSGIQRKFYAPGVGNIKVTAVDDPEGETLDLTRVRTLSASERATARAAALQLERRAYEISAVYRRTQPAQ